MALAALALQAHAYPMPTERDFTVRGFRFASGQVLPELRLHCTTIGEPRRNPKTGKVDNAVLLMHGTGGDSHSLLAASFADELFGPGQPLDAARYFLILPAAIGHGGSSKPSDGLRARFPKYRYDDIVRAQHILVFDLLKVDRLRLVMGTSMGGMQTWVWGEKYPDAMDALMPLACAPFAIAGRNRMVRRMAIDAIRNDPLWKGGDYEAQPPSLRVAADVLIIMGSSALQMLKAAPTRDEADALLARSEEAQMRRTDANDLLYALESSGDYDPAPDLGKIVAPLTAVNSADDFINPPELTQVGEDVRKVKGAEFVMLPVSDRTRGHGTHTIAALWKEHLVALLKRSERMVP